MYNFGDIMSEQKNDYREYLESIEDTEERLLMTKRIARDIEEEAHLYNPEDLEWARHVLRNC